MPTEEKISKAAAVREGIAKFGGPDGNFHNQEIVDWVKKKYDLDVDTQTVSAQKSTIRSQNGKGTSSTLVQEVLIPAHEEDDQDENPSYQELMRLREVEAEFCGLERLKKCLRALELLLEDRR